MATTKINDTQIDVTGSVQLLKLFNINDGTAAANKAVVVDGSKDVSGLRNVSATSFTGDGSGLTGISSDTVDVTATSADAEYNLVSVLAGDDGVTLRVIDDGKVYYNTSNGNLKTAGTLNATGAINGGSNLQINGTFSGASTIAGSGLASLGSLAVDDGSTIGTDSDADMLTLTNADNITVASDVSFVVTAGKLEIGDGNAVTATAAELNYVDITTLGTAAASKALVADASAEIDAGAITFTDLGAVTTVDINGGTIDGANVTVGAGKTLDVSAGTLTTSAAQNLAIMQGAAADVDIGAYDLRANTVTADSLTSGRVPFASTAGLLVDDADFSFATDTLTVTKLGAFEAAGAIDFSNQVLTDVGSAVTCSINADSFYFFDATDNTARYALIGDIVPTMASNGLRGNGNGQLYLTWRSAAYSRARGDILQGSGDGTSEQGTSWVSCSFSGSTALSSDPMVFLNGMLQNPGSGSNAEMQDAARDYIAYTSASNLVVCFRNSLDSDDVVNVRYLES